MVGNLVFISEAYGRGSSLLKVRPSGYQVVWKDAPRRAQQINDVALEHRHLPQRLPLRLQRAARSGFGLALHQTGIRRGYVVRTD